MVPEAVPEPPVDVVHCTEVTPRLSAAVPVTVSDAAEVLTMVEPGEVICSEGGVVLEPVVGVAAGGVAGDVDVGVTGVTGDVAVGSVGVGNGGVKAGVPGAGSVVVAGGVTVEVTGVLTGMVTGVVTGVVIGIVTGGVGDGVTTPDGSTDCCDGAVVLLLP
jgi:hypothetical protein